MLDLKYEFLSDVEVDLEEPIDVGSTPHGVRMIYNTKGGTVEGPKISGIGASHWRRLVAHPT